MTHPTAADVRPRMWELVDHLRRGGAIRSPEWADAFSRVPRHVFVPHWYEQSVDMRGIAVWNQRDAADEEAWLSAVYSDATLVTALDPGTAQQVGEQAWTGVATSSSTQPSLMAGMLEELWVYDGHRVLEVGTGTGYNAGLLCARLGDQSVRSVDVDPRLVDAAGERLAQAGYKPQLLAADGQEGWPDGAPYDRIIATCSVPRLPVAWVEQVRPAGVIIADMDFGLEGGILRLSMQPGRETVLGQFTRTSGRFMPARSRALSYAPRNRTPYAPETEQRPSTVTTADIRSNYAFRLLLAFTLPRAELVYHLDDQGGTAVQLQTADGVWARVPLVGEATVTYGGTGELWQQVEAAWSWWNSELRPGHQDFAVAVEPGGRMEACYVPDGRRWPLSG